MRQNNSHDNSQNNSQAGNVFILILLGVFLFGALMYAFSRGAQQGTGNLTSRQAKVSAQEILNYARLVGGAVDRVRRNGCSENQISFENATVGGYVNAGAPVDNSCHVFEDAGGKIGYAAPPHSWIDNSFSSYAGDNSRQWGEWAYSGYNTIPFVGSSCSTQDCKELIMGIHFLKRDICLEINDKLGIPTTAGEPPPERISSPPGGLETVKYIGTFFNAASGIDNSAMRDVETACLRVEVSGDDYYFFYHVLLAR